MRARQGAAASIRPWTIVALLASAWLLVFFVLTKIIGPLNPDEVLFSHVLWLTLEGKRQYIDFYSYHFPTYFFLYGLALPHGNGPDLGFVWAVRLSNLLIAGAYVAMLFAVERRSALFLLPLLLLMLSVSRMIEVRPDTIGLLAFNGAWAILLVRKGRLSLVFATLLAILAAACSARGVAMGAGYGLALCWRSMVERDWRVLLVPIAVLAGALALGLGAFAADPQYVRIMLRATLLDPGEVLPNLSIAQRTLAVDRLPQTLLYLVAVLLGLTCAVRGDRPSRSGVIAIAAFTQLFLIFFDPSPFPYVYGWAAIPSLAGLALAGRVFNRDQRKWLAAAGALCAVALFAATVVFPWMRGRMPPTGSNYRVIPDAPLRAESIRSLPLEKLVALELSREHQQSLANQLLVREELCRRITGTVLAVWQNHPICVDDAAYYGFSIMWPNILANGTMTPQPWFEAAFARHRAQLFIWNTGIRGASLTLNPSVVTLLKGYEIERGFAIMPAELPTTSKTGNFDKAASRPNSARR